MKKMLNRVKNWLRFSKPTEEELREQAELVKEHAPIPVIGLLGKTGSGKTSIVKFLTGAEAAEIGNGYRPQTKDFQQYDFPTEDQPVLRFLDTRGLGEIGYDADADLSEFGNQSHVVIVVVRVMDHAVADIVEITKKLKAAAPQRQIILALTCLHQVSPEFEHPEPDPFDKELLPTSISEDLRRSIQKQQERFGKDIDQIIPIDLTKPEEGFPQPNFGGERLVNAIVSVLPNAYRQTLVHLEVAMKSLGTLKERKAMPYIISYATMCGTAAAVPVPWVDIPVVMGLQAQMVRQLAKLYDQPMDKQRYAEIAGSTAGRMLVHVFLRGPMKMIPVFGHVANAAAAFAYTFALGKVCCWYFGKVRQGNAPTQGELKSMWAEQIQVAQELWQKKTTDEPHQEPAS